VRGGIGYQVTRIFVESGIDCKGESRHEAKKAARDEGARGSHQIAKKTYLYGSLSTTEYKNVWHALARFAKEEMGLKDLEKMTGTHVEKYFWTRVEAGVDRDTFMKECSAIEKWELVLNLYAQKAGTGNKYDFQNEISFMRTLAKEIMGNEIRSRAHKNPEAIIAVIAVKDHLIEARIQYESGTRIHEGSRIEAKQLRGTGNDKYTGRPIGTITVKGKGGRVRDVLVSIETYKEIEIATLNERVFRVNRDKYYESLEEACRKAGEVYDGSHGFRWCFVRRRLKEIQEAGYSREEAFAIVAEELGHGRSSITGRYAG
jgi:integrase